MSGNIDKVNMSLDDIIKLEKKQKRFQQQGRGGAAGAPQQKGPANGGQARGRGRPPASNKQQQQRKPFGLLNKSKAIGKKKSNNLAGGGNKQRVGRPAGPAAVKAAAASLKSRLSGPGIGPAKQQQLGKMQNLARIRRRRNNPAAVNPPANKAFNRYGGKASQQPAKFQNQAQQAPANKLARKPAIVQAKQAGGVRGRPGVAGGLNKAQSDLVKAKIAMQAARKNVQKAKRLLAARKGPIQQMASKKFSKNLATVKKIKQRVTAAKKVKLMAKTKLSQPRGMVRVNVPNGRKAGLPQSTKPVIKRSRPAPKQASAAGAGKSGANRMVFY